MSYAATEQILLAVQSAREQAQRAESGFERARAAIRRRASRSRGLFGWVSPKRRAELAQGAQRACDDLFNAYQSLVTAVDEECRPLLDQEPSLRAVREVKELIRWLNEKSEIENDILPPRKNRKPAEETPGRHTPGADSRTVQSFWESKYDSWPGRAEELEAQRAEEEARRRLAQEWAEKKAAAKVHMEQVVDQCSGKARQFRKDLEVGVRGREQELRDQVREEQEKLQQQEQELEAQIKNLGFFRIIKKKKHRGELALLKCKQKYLADPQLVQDEVTVVEKRAAAAGQTYGREVLAYLNSRFPYSKGGVPGQDKTENIYGLHEYSEDPQVAETPCPEPPAVQDVLQ